MIIYKDNLTTRSKEICFIYCNLKHIMQDKMYRNLLMLYVLMRKILHLVYDMVILVMNFKLRTRTFNAT